MSRPRGKALQRLSSASPVPPGGSMVTTLKPAQSGTPKPESPFPWGHLEAGRQDVEAAVP